MIKLVYVWFCPHLIFYVLVELCVNSDCKYYYSLEPPLQFYYISLVYLIERNLNPVVFRTEYFKHVKMIISVRLKQNFKISY